MWEKIESADIENAKHNLTLRRAETLSRHAEELKALDAEQTDVDELMSAVAKFMSKFGKGAGSEHAPSPSEAEPPVVRMGLNFR